MTTVFTPQPLIKQRSRLADRLLARSAQAPQSTSPLSPIANLLFGISGGLNRNAANQAQLANQQFRTDALTGLGEGGNVGRQLLQSGVPEFQNIGAKLLGANETARIKAFTGGISKVPIFAEDEQGNTVLLQPTTAGTAVKTKLPQGITPSTGIRVTQTPTSVITQNKRTGEVISVTQKDVRGASREREIGKGQGERIAGFPKVVAKVSRFKRIIDSIRNDPNKAIGTGKSAIGNRIPFTPGFDFQKKVNQAKGAAFLQAFESIKGGGQITEIEGKKATDAISRLSVLTSEEAFNEALDDLEEVIDLGLERARAGIVVANPETGVQPLLPSNPVTTDRTSDFDSIPQGPLGQPPRRKFNPATGKIE